VYTRISIQAELKHFKKTQGQGGGKHKLAAHLFFGIEDG
jgi:hypothetical protein